MRLHAQAGHADHLETAYRHCVQVLADELGVAPARETQFEYARLRGAVTAPHPFPPAINFAAGEGGSVAYSIFGKGPPLVVVPGKRCTARSVSSARRGMFFTCSWVRNVLDASLPVASR